MNCSTTSFEQNFPTKIILTSFINNVFQKYYKICKSNCFNSPGGIGFSAIFSMSKLIHYGWLAKNNYNELSPNGEEKYFHAIVYLDDNNFCCSCLF